MDAWQLAESWVHAITISDLPSWKQSDLLNDPIIQLTIVAKMVIKADTTHLMALCLAMNDSVPNLGADEDCLYSPLNLV